MDGIPGVIANLSGTLNNLIAELPSFWLLVQFGILLATGAIGAVAGMTARRRVDLDAVSAGWPPIIKLVGK